MPARTQEALYAKIDLDLSWSEAQLPQAERTKHVHGLHPYLGKFVPQIVEVFLGRYLEPGQLVYDPFAGSGTTLVEANVHGFDAAGCDISAFNCLLARTKTDAHRLGSLELALRGTLAEARERGPAPIRDASKWLRDWFSPRALGELLSYRAAIDELLDGPPADVARVVLSRSARSARQTTHFDLDFPKAPQLTEYYCHKHKRMCRPVDEAGKFLARYTADTIKRLREFAAISTSRSVDVMHEDARSVELSARPDGIITSPPYPGLIDYHEQHRYAYDLLGLRDRRDSEIGPAVRGATKRALGSYVDDMTLVLRNSTRQLAPGAPIVIVVNDSRSLYPEILERSGLVMEERLTRHVNRRTGRRAGEFFESILVCRARRR
jgi:DNA methylase